MTNNGFLIIIEPKGDYLDGSASREKLKIGRTWQNESGKQYRYYMLFAIKDLKIEGAYCMDEFMDIIKDL